jgi:hypothetical protein
MSNIPSSSRRYCIYLGRCLRGGEARRQWRGSGRNRIWQSPCAGGVRGAVGDISQISKYDRRIDLQSRSC